MTATTIRSSPAWAQTGDSIHGLETTTTNFYSHLQSVTKQRQQLRCSFTLIINNCVFFHPGVMTTEYNDDHILALQEFLSDILRSNTILPSCSNVIFRSGDMFANFSFELVWKFSWNSTHWRWKPTYKANAMFLKSIEMRPHRNVRKWVACGLSVAVRLLISYWQLAEPIAIWCRSEHLCFYPPIVDIAYCT